MDEGVLSVDVGSIEEMVYIAVAQHDCKTVAEIREGLLRSGLILSSQQVSAALQRNGSLMRDGQGRWIRRERF